MKKWFSVVLIFVMVMSLSACSSNEKEISKKSLREQGLDVVSLMVEITRSEDYIELYTSSGEVMEIVQKIGTGDFTTPKAVYAITVNDETLLELFELNNLDVSEELKSALMNRVFGSFITQVNGLSGMEKLTASSICTMGKTFIDNSVTNNVIYIYTYENAFPVAVAFIVGEDGSVSASGNFILYEEFSYDSAEEIQEFFSDFQEFFSDFGVIVSEVE